MTGPDGDVSHCYWQWLVVEPRTSFGVLEGFATADGQPDAEMPSMRMTVAFETTQAGSRATATTYFNNVDELATLVDMGMEEGMRHSMAQMGEVIADLRSFSADLPVTAQILSDTKVRISRLISGPVDAVWRAHHEKELLQQWLLGLEGWSMPGESIINETTFTPVAEATLLSILITYPNIELRDMVLATGMTDGMEAGYVRLEAKVLLPA